MTPEVIADASCAAGTCPAWHAAENALWWLDPARGSLLRWDAAAKKHAVVLGDRPAAALTVQSDGSLLVFLETGETARFRGNGLEVLPGETAAPRVTAAAVDTKGRVLCGVVRGRAGSLFLLERDGRRRPLVDTAGRIAGLAFTPDGDGLYVADPASRRIDLYDYDARACSLSRPRLFVELAGSLGSPRGIAVDAKGFAWVAAWGGSAVARYSPAGKEDQRVYFTARTVSGAAFGGEDMKDLFVASGGGDDRAANGPTAGAVFRVRVGIRGIAPRLSAVRL